MGSCHAQWSTPAPTAARAGLVILCIEYRLAPENPFPAGLNDALAVYKALLQQVRLLCAYAGLQDSWEAA